MPWVDNSKSILCKFVIVLLISARQRSFGNVMFSVLCVCLSTGGGVSHVTIAPHHAGTPCIGTLPRPSLDMFKLVQLGPHCTGTPGTCSNDVPYETRIIGTRLECFLLAILVIIGSSGGSPKEHWEHVVVITVRNEVAAR